MEEVVEASGHGVTARQAALQWGSARSSRSSSLWNLASVTREPRMKVFSNMITCAARTQAAKSGRTPGVLGVELRRVQPREHGEESVVGLLVLGERVAAWIERA